MDTHHFSIRVEPFANGTRLWSLEHSARLLATEVYEVENVVNGHRRIMTRSVDLVRDGHLIDRLIDGVWASGEPVACQL
jgi:hypothetical protein